jgi:TetR/AcrR family transcriptional regulator, mexJK operon transcriptional repressor
MNQAPAAESLRFSRRDRVAQDKREEILDVAASFFLSHGYAGSSVSAMARQSGISKESFYRYFSSKEELFMAVIDQELREYKRTLEQLTEHWDEEDLREFMLKFASTLLPVLMAERTQALRGLVFNEIRRAPEIGRHYHSIGPALAYQTLERFFALHRVETRFEPRMLSRAFMALLLHELMLERNCGLRGNLSADETAALAAPIVDNFIEAYFTLPRKARKRLAPVLCPAANRR